METHRPCSVMQADVQLLPPSHRFTVGYTTAWMQFSFTSALLGNNIFHFQFNYMYFKKFLNIYKNVIYSTIQQLNFKK